MLKNKETQTIRYAPEDISVEEVLNVILGYGCNNSTLEPEKCEDNSKKFMISIRVYDVS